MTAPHRKAVYSVYVTVYSNRAVADILCMQQIMFCRGQTSLILKLVSVDFRQYNYYVLPRADILRLKAIHGSTWEKAPM